MADKVQCNVDKAKGWISKLRLLNIADVELIYDRDKDIAYLKHYRAIRPVSMLADELLVQRIVLDIPEYITVTGIDGLYEVMGIDRSIHISHMEEESPLEPIFDVYGYVDLAIKGEIYSTAGLFKGMGRETDDRYASYLSLLRIKEIHTSNCTDFSYMFSNVQCRILDISKLDTSKARRMVGMFMSSSIDSLIVFGLKLENVESMESMFEGFSGLIDGIKTWHTKNVRNIQSMFDGCNQQFRGYLNDIDMHKVVNSEGVLYHGENVGCLDIMRCIHNGMKMDTLSNILGVSGSVKKIVNPFSDIDIKGMKYGDSSYSIIEIMQLISEFVDLMHGGVLIDVYECDTIIKVILLDDIYGIPSIDMDNIKIYKDGWNFLSIQKIIEYIWEEKDKYMKDTLLKQEELYDNINEDLKANEYIVSAMQSINGIWINK